MFDFSPPSTSMARNAEQLRRSLTAAGIHPTTDDEHVISRLALSSLVVAAITRWIGQAHADNTGWSA